MTNEENAILAKLHLLGFNIEQAQVYLELVQQPLTTIQISRATGIPRTNVYRIFEQLEKRSLITRHSDERGIFWIAADPTSLAVTITAQEELLTQQKLILQQLIPQLTSLQKSNNNAFAIRTYKGDEGLKQMFWNELKTKGELCALGYATVEQIIQNPNWAEKHRQLSSEANYRIREIKNENDTIPTLSKYEDYMKRYYCRIIPSTILPLTHQIVIYNDTTAIYYWQQKKKFGLEILNKEYANTMRAIFNHYWELAT